MKNNGIDIECSHCGYNWTYRGSAKRATCPSCGLNNTYENKEEKAEN